MKKKNNKKPSIDFNEFVLGLTKQLARYGETSKEESKKIYHSIRITDNVLFEEEDNHYKIKDMYIPILKFLDLSKIKFDKVDINGIDFSDTNAKIDKRKVYKKKSK